jgi:hypothetical protein
VVTQTRPSAAVTRSCPGKGQKPNKTTGSVDSLVASGESVAAGREGGKAGGCLDFPKILQTREEGTSRKQSHSKDQLALQSSNDKKETRLEH